MADNRYRDIQKLYHAGQALVRKQKYDQAIAKFKRITGSDLHTLPLPEAAPGAPLEGAEAELAALRPFYVKAHVSLAVCYTEKGMFQEAISVLRRASQIDPGNADALCALGYVYRRNGMVEAAVEAFQKALECNPRCARAQKSLAFLAIEQGRFEDAVRLCREAIQADPAYGQAYVELAGALHLMGRDAEALEVLKQAVALDLGNMEFVLRHISHLREAGKLEEALEALRWAVGVSADPMLRLALAECCLELDRHEAAREACLRVLRERPRDLYALDLLQNSYIRTGELGQALRIACRLAALCPQDTMIHFRKAVLHQELGDPRLALEGYERVLAMEKEGSELARRAREAIELLEGAQIRQVLVLAGDDPLFRARLRRDAARALAERGFYLTEGGLGVLDQLALDARSASPPGRPRRTYH